MRVPLTRRWLLIVGAGISASAVAGCPGARRSPDQAFVLSLDIAETDDLIETFTTTGNEWVSTQTDIFETARDESAAIAYGDPVFEDGLIIQTDKSIYQLSVSQNAVERIERPVLGAEPVDDDATVEEPVDIEWFHGGAEEAVGSVVQSVHGGDPEPHVFYQDDVLPPQLFPEPREEHVSYVGEVYRLSVAHRNIEADRFEYELAELAEADSTLEEVIAETYSFTVFGEFSDEATEILEGTIDGPEYRADMPFSDAEEELLNRLDVKVKDVGVANRWIRHDQEYYHATFSWWHSD